MITETSGGITRISVLLLVLYLISIALTPVKSSLLDGMVRPKERKFGMFFCGSQDVFEPVGFGESIVVQKRQPLAARQLCPEVIGGRKTPVFVQSLHAVWMHQNMRVTDNGCGSYKHQEEVGM